MKFSESCRQGARVNKRTGWRIWTTSSSTWWQTGKWDWQEFLFSLTLLQVVISFTVDEIRCNRRRVSVNKKTSHAFFSHALCTPDYVLTPHNGSSRVRSRVIHMSSMFAHERSSSFSCYYSSPLTLPSYPWPPPRLWLLSRHCQIRRPLTRFHETRPMALWPYLHLLQVMSPMRPTIPTT